MTEQDLHEPAWIVLIEHWDPWEAPFVWVVGAADADGAFDAEAASAVAVDIHVDCQELEELPTVLKVFWGDPEQYGGCYNDLRSGEIVEREAGSGLL